MTFRIRIKSDSLNVDVFSQDILVVVVIVYSYHNAIIWFDFTVGHRTPVGLRTSAFRGPRRVAETAHVEFGHTHGTGVAVSVHHIARGLAPG